MSVFPRSPRKLLESLADRFDLPAGWSVEVEVDVRVRLVAILRNSHAGVVVSTDEFASCCLRNPFLLQQLSDRPLDCETVHPQLFL